MSDSNTFYWIKKAYKGKSIISFFLEMLSVFINRFTLYSNFNTIMLILGHNTYVWMTWCRWRCL